MNKFILLLLLSNAAVWIGIYWILPLSAVAFYLLLAFIFTGVAYSATYAKRKQERVYELLYDGLLSLQDRDFSISLPDDIGPKYRHILSLFNEVADKLRIERQSLYQRELMLDKVVNASNVATLLVNHRQSIVFANIAAKHLFRTSELIGQDFSTMLGQHGKFLLPHMSTDHAIVQSTSGTGEEHSFHFSQHQLKLHNASHRLYLIKPITEALHRQELQTWKKVIRVINHELNNSIAPISSMCHSGKMLADKYQDPRLTKVFDIVSTRISKLSDFITSYSQLAKISTPKKAPLNIIKSLESLKSLYYFNLITAEKDICINADVGQLEQLFINLLKNANEASIDNDLDAQIHVNEDMENVYVTVRDFGRGMSEKVITQAFLPYFSTKENGSGIGLTVCRDIVEAHQGKIQLSNHHEGGLSVRILLPKT